MNRKQLTFIAVVAGVFVAIVLFRARPVPEIRQPPQATFIGFTNGVVGPAAAAYGALSTNHAAFIQRWFSSGTNVALFRIINHRHWPIRLFRSGALETLPTVLTNHVTFMLDGSGFGDIFIPVGQTVTVQVAMSQQQGIARMRFTYARGEYDSAIARLMRLPRDLRALLTNAGVINKVELNTLESFESDWFGP